MNLMREELIQEIKVQQTRYDNGLFYDYTKEELEEHIWLLLDELSHCSNLEDVIYTDLEEK